MKSWWKVKPEAPSVCNSTPRPAPCPTSLSWLCPEEPTLLLTSNYFSLLPRAPWHGHHGTVQASLCRLCNTAGRGAPWQSSQWFWKPTVPLSCALLFSGKAKYSGHIAHRHKRPVLQPPDLPGTWQNILHIWWANHLPTSCPHYSP